MQSRILTLVFGVNFDPSFQALAQVRRRPPVCLGSQKASLPQQLSRDRILPVLDNGYKRAFLNLLAVQRF